MAVRAGIGAATAAANGKNVFQGALRSVAADPATRFLVDTASATARGENVLKAVQKAAQAGIGDVRESLRFAAMVAPFVPGLGTGVAAALGAANALASGERITDALIAGARNAIPGGALAQTAFDTAANLAKGKNLGDAALSAARSQLPGGPAAQAAFDAGLALAKGKNIQEAIIAGGGRLLPKSPFSADALSFVKKVASGENLGRAALSATGNMVLKRVEQQTGPIVSRAVPRQVPWRREGEFGASLGEFAFEFGETFESAVGQASGSNSTRGLRERLAAMKLSPGLRKAIRLAKQRRGRPAAGELESVGTLGGELNEMENQPAKKKAMILAFTIPESPYSDDLMARLHKAFEVVEGVDAVVTMFEAELTTLLGVAAMSGLGLVLGIAAPLAGFLAAMAALGSGYAEGRAKVARERTRFGFALGVVTGADWRSWKHAKSLFWEWTPEVNTFDKDSGKIAQRAFNLGLVSGFIQGRKLSSGQRRFFWGSLGTTLSEGDRTLFAGDNKLWSQRLWVEWYIRAGASFLKLYAKD
jgi:hypothetical protein